jgi:hypothetical protein
MRRAVLYVPIRRIARRGRTRALAKAGSANSKPDRRTIHLTGSWQKHDSRFVLVEGIIQVGADGSATGVLVWRNVCTAGLADGLVNREFVDGTVGPVLALEGTRVEPSYLKPDCYEIRLWGGQADSGFYTGRSRAAHGRSRWDAAMSGTYRVTRRVG